MLCEGLVQGRDAQTDIERCIIITLVPQNSWVTPHITEIHKKHWVDLSTPTELLVELYTLDKRGVINQPLVYEANSNTGVTPSPV